MYTRKYPLTLPLSLPPFLPHLLHYSTTTSTTGKNSAAALINRGLESLLLALHRSLTTGSLAASLRASLLTLGVRADF